MTQRGEILWTYVRALTGNHTLSGYETVFEPTYEQADVRVLATNEPPYVNDE